MSAKKFNPKIVDIQTRLDANSYLDQLYTLFSQPGTRFNEAENVLEEACDQIGEEALIVEMCRRLSTREIDDTSPLVWALEEIGGPQTVQHLRRIIDDPQTNSQSRLDAAYVLMALGQPIENIQMNSLPGKGLKDLLDEGENSLSQVAPDERAFALIELLNGIEQRIGAQNSDAFYETLIAGLQTESHPLAADMLWVIGTFKATEQIRQSAKQALLKTQQTPTQSMIDGVFDGQFLTAHHSVDHKTHPTQGQLLVIIKQPSGSHILYSFLFDHTFWGGSVKNFFIVPSQSQEDIQAILSQIGIGILQTEEIDVEQTRKQIREALQANVRQSRPIPPDYRGHHELIVHTLFQGESPIELPTQTEEDRSPLSGKAGQVENLLIPRMREAAFAPDQITNARMLWRDFFQTESPAIRKPEVWAACIDYVIGMLEGRIDQTQQTTAERYGVSAGSISQRYVAIYDEFLDVKNGAIAYQTEKAQASSFGPDDFADFFDEDLMEDLWEEDEEPTYEDYLTAYRQYGEGRPKLKRKELEERMRELDALYNFEDRLTPEKKKRISELEHLLLFDIDGDF